MSEQRAGFKAMQEGTPEDWQLISSHFNFVNIIKIHRIIQ